MVAWENETDANFGDLEWGENPSFTDWNIEFGCWDWHSKSTDDDPISSHIISCNPLQSSTNRGSCKHCPVTKRTWWVKGCLCQDSPQVLGGCFPAGFFPVVHQSIQMMINSHYKNHQSSTVVHHQYKKIIAIFSLSLYSRLAVSHAKKTKDSWDPQV